ncbi:hypothetical protein EV132_1389 [Rhizobium sullae]|uniref:Uncharacterized protein n=2 Tax=Rhizobium sullae TaxID=50338 RepID=A0A4R3PYZ3_RHISU|nr:hypothetical protein EV132_1389 [Rhizobium sullae]
MIVRMYPPYYARRDPDATWSIVDIRTGMIVVIAETVLLQHLDEATIMDIIDVLRERDSTSGWTTSPLRNRELR